jgi:MoaA/NifB/PqqE/SkfB family radical SAM enzyme
MFKKELKAERTNRDFFSDLSRIPALLMLPFRYKKSIAYVFKKKGLQGVLDFLFVKYTVPDEGGEFSILTPLVRMFPQLTPYPYKVEVEPSTICNKKCIMCEHTYWKEKSERLTLEDAKKIADNFPNWRWVNITGMGSGFLNNEFLDIIEYLSKRRVSINFVDEFEFLDEKMANKLIDIGVNCIWCSFDAGTKETYEKLKVGCDFDKVIENLKTMARVKKERGSPLPAICFRFVANKMSVNELSDFIRLIHSLDILGEGSKINFTSILSFPEIEHLYIPEIPKEIAQEALRTAKDLGIRVEFSHINQLPDISRCGAWAEPYIMIGGYVMPCCAVLMSNKRDYLRKHAFGNIYETPFKDIWYSKRYKRFRQNVPRKTGKVPLLCANCRAYCATERQKRYGIDTET